jgi:hypothetical protein
MKTAWYCLLGGLLVCLGCVTLPKPEEKHPEPAPPPAPPPVVKPRRPAGNLTPEMVNEHNAPEATRRLLDELDRDEQAEPPPMP